MLTIFGQKNRFCDGVSRRNFLRIGALGVGAASLTLTDIFRAEAQAGAGPTSSQHKAVINIFLGGGPPHQDMWDLKMEAPVEIRGEFKPIATNVPGIQICEVFPRIAARMDKCAVIRSIVGASGGHDARSVHDRLSTELAGRAGRPAQSRFDPRQTQGTGRSLRAAVRRPGRSRRSICRGRDAGRPGSWARRMPPFKPDGPGMANLTLKGTSLDSWATASNCSPASTACAENR